MAPWMKYTEIFSALKIEIFWKKFDISNVFAQNIECGYKLEPPCLAKIRKIGIRLNTPVLLYIKVGFKGVYILMDILS